ncbi:MAG TPA: SCO family protein [Phototrophicaceae bacterium]|nr:SCO family protein [Phototrophicaceae bacterium]
MTAQAKNTRNLLIGMLVCGVLLIGIFATISLRQSLSQAQATPTPTDAPSGVVAIDPPKTLTDFTLPGIDGKPLQFSSLRGKYTMMFFGYTHCPDFCPITLTKWQSVKQALGSDASSVNFLFISVDGERDMPPVMAKYLSNFDPSFLGMTGDDATLAKIGTDYGLYYDLHKEEGANYSVDHTTQEYLVNPQGQLVVEFDFYTDAGVIAQTIQSVIHGPSE